MKTLTYQGNYRHGKLNDELVGAIPALAPTGSGMEQAAVFTIGGDDTYAELVVPDETDEGQVQAVVQAHDPSTPGPAEQEEITSGENELSINERLEQQIPVLQEARDAITANPPTIFGSLTNQERVVLRNLIRNEIQLIRSVLELYEAVE